MHKNTTSYAEQILEVTRLESKAVQPLTSHHLNYSRRTKHARHCKRSKDELLSDILLWVSSHGHTSVGQPASTYLQQLYMDTGGILENLPGAMDDRKGIEKKKQ